MRATKIAKKWLPPILIEYFKPLFGIGVYFSGHYADWATASAHASGYDSAIILERIKQATLKVQSGEVAFERDSVVFNEVQHSYPVLAGLLRAGADHDAQLSVLDFGGSLGSSYFQCRNFLSVFPSLKWGIVEQEHFVRCGQEFFETNQLRFFYTIKECIQQTTPNVALLSGVLQYLSEPYEVLDKLMESNIPYIVIDRTPFAERDGDCITVQHVPPSIYPASYPCRIFGRQSFLNKFRGRYEVAAQFESNDSSATASRLKFTFGGMILRNIR